MIQFQGNDFTGERERKVRAHARNREKVLPVASGNICGTRAAFYILF